MCSPALCRQCGKTTWQGCGSHVAEVMAAVPPAQQCDCQRQDRPSLLKRLTRR